jgi:hypothetical protein
MDHTHKRASSLNLLESALIAAKRSTPSRVPRPEMDPNEKLAALLIERIKDPHPVLLPALPIGLPEPCTPTPRLEWTDSDV